MYSIIYFSSTSFINFVFVQCIVPTGNFRKVSQIIQRTVIVFETIGFRNITRNSIKWVPRHYEFNKQSQELKTRLKRNELRNQNSKSNIIVIWREESNWTTVFKDLVILISLLNLLFYLLKYHTPIYIL